MGPNAVIFERKVPNLRGHFGDKGEFLGTFLDFWGLFGVFMERLVRSITDVFRAKSQMSPNKWGHGFQESALGAGFRCPQFYIYY